MHNYEYVGCFFDYEELMALVAPVRRNPLKNHKLKPHVTFEYDPGTVLSKLFGTTIVVTILGYGNDGENEGLKVALTSDNEVINAMIRKIPVPHITLTVSDTGRAVNTRYLDFAEIDPLTIVGQYGGHEWTREEG